jgi:hypothetical protein
MQICTYMYCYGLVVIVTLIYEAFEHVSNIPFLIIKFFLGNYTFSLFHFSGSHGFLVSKSPSKKGFLLAGFLEGSLYHSLLILTTFHTSSPLFPHLLGFHVH